MPDQSQCLCRCHWCAKQIVQRQAIFNILQHEIQQAILLAIIVDRQNVVVLQGRDRPCLALEAHSELRVAIREQHFHGHVPIERLLVGLVDRCHAAVANCLDQMILPKLSIYQIAHSNISCAPVVLLLAGCVIISLAMLNAALGYALALES